MAFLIGFNPNQTYATLNEGRGHQLKEVTEDSGGKRWMFVQANGAIAQYDVVAIDEAGQAAPVTKALLDDNYKVGVAGVAFADNEYGFVQIYGECTFNMIGVSTTADLKLYSTATAGALSPTATSQTAVRGIVATADAGTTSAASVAGFMSTEPQSDAF